MKEDKALFAYLVFVVLFLAAILSSPYWAFGTSTYTDKFGLEMPAQGDVGWDDAFRINHKIFEVAIMPVLEGNLVFSGATPSDGGGLSLSWSAGWVQFSGVSKYLPSGATTLANNTMSWLSAVTASVSSGATIQARSTEYDIPSGASGFAHVPIAVAWTEAGDIVRLKDLRYMPMPKYNMDQNVHSGATPIFQGAYISDMADAAKINARSGLTGPSGTSPTATQSGAIYVDTNDKSLQVGVSGAGYNLPLEERIYVIITSPDLLDNKNQQPIWKNLTGQTLYITGATFYCSTSGNSIEGISYSSTPINFQFGAGVTLFNFVNMTTAGTSVYSKEYNTGVSAVPQDRTILLDYGIGTPDWIAIEIVGRYMGARP